jgi:adenylate cyclase, class 2
MAFEVELKAPCPDAESKVRALGAIFVRSEEQDDVYFTHPCRDFKETDEALRLRRSGGLRLTYKGPKRRADLKEREEIEFEVPQDAFALLDRLGFKRAFQIRKTRRTYSLDGLTLCCDKVEGLGEYLEVESMGDGGERIMGVFRRLHLEGDVTTKSYSELVGI